MPKLVDLIGANLSEWSIPLLQAIFGSADAAFIVRAVDTFCATELGSTIEEAHFFETSQGAVFGLHLQDGRRIVIKAHPPKRSLGFLIAVVRVQQHLVKHGYPCPPLLLDPRPLGAGHAIVEELIDEGSYTDAHDPSIRRSMAEMLAWLIELTEHLEAIPGLQPSALDRRLPPDVLWPPPHNAMFNFEATAPGAEWIDDLAHEAKKVMTNSPGQLVLGHTDWSVKHLRYLDGKVRVIYDWDSLALNTEPVLVGDAARGFPMTWFLNVSLLPTQEEAHAFVAEYAAARGRTFTSDEQKAMSAAATYGIAYGARIEHSLEPRVIAYPAGSYREALARYGNGFLTFSSS